MAAAVKELLESRYKIVLIRFKDGDYRNGNGHAK